MSGNLFNKIKLSYYILKFNIIRNTRFSHTNYNNYKLFKELNVNKILKELKTNGYSIIENYLNPVECEQIRNKINEVIHQRKEEIWSDNLQSDKRIFGFNHVCELSKKFFFCSEILKLVSLYMHCKMESIFTMANKLNYVSQNKGSGGGWHRDSITPIIKSMVYLVDVDADVGPFEIIKDSNKFANILLDNEKMNNKLLLNTRFSEEQVKKINNFAERLVTIKGSKGSLIIFDGSNLHRGKPIKKNVRYAITNYYFPIGKMSQKKYHARPQIFDQ